ncbi:heterogeneous nuclear ribonucleoprotein 27C-like isoform X1 [Haemaphysalis longicornis]
MARRDNEEHGKIFVGGLSWDTTQDGLRSYFSRFGEVVGSVVMCYETGGSRGFGFVTFRDPSCVATVLAGGPHQLDGRTVDPKSCIPRSANRAGGGGGSFGGRGGQSKGSTTKIFVWGLPATVTKTDLHAFFSEYGKVTETLIMYDQEQRSRGFGFVTFDSEDPVNQLTSQRYVHISGKQVECKRAEPRESRLPTVGGGGDGWGGQQQQGSSNGGGNSGCQGGRCRGVVTKEPERCCCCCGLWGALFENYGWAERDFIGALRTRRGTGHAGPSSPREGPLASARSVPAGSRGGSPESARQDLPADVDTIATNRTFIVAASTDEVAGAGALPERNRSGAVAAAACGAHPSRTTAGRTTSTR